MSVNLHGTVGTLVDVELDQPGCFGFLAAHILALAQLKEQIAVVEVVNVLPCPPRSTLRPVPLCHMFTDPTLPAEYDPVATKIPWGRALPIVCA